MRTENILYNPHGSDVTNKHRSWCYYFNRLYNPHGSDVTLRGYIPLGNLKKLYNPHGSDVTDHLTDPATLNFFFITHTVQM